MVTCLVSAEVLASIGMALLKFFQVTKKPDLPDSVIKWQWVASSKLLKGKKINNDERQGMACTEYLKVLLKLELDTKIIASKSVYS